MSYILFTLLSFYQEIPNEKIEIVLHENTVHMDVGQQTFTLEDEDGSYSIEDVIQANYQSRFIKSNQNILTFPPNDSYYWIKFCISSNTNKRFFIFIDEAKFKEIDLYYKVGGSENWKVYKNGFSVPQNQRVIAANFQAFPINLTKDTQGEFYIRLQPHLVPFPISIESETYFFQIKNSLYNLILGLVIGIIFFIGVNNLVLYFSLGNKLRLVYFFIALSFVLFSILFNGLIYLVSPFIYQNLLRFIVPLAFISQFLVVLYGVKFLQVRKYFLWLHNWSMFFLYVLVVLIVLSFFTSGYFIIMFLNITGTLSLISCLLMGILTWRKSNSVYKSTTLIYSCSYILFFLFLIVENCHLYFNLDYYFIVRFIDIGFLCEAAGLAVALSVQTGIDKSLLVEAKNNAQAENLLLISKQNQILEVRVSHRTFDLEEKTKIAEQLSNEYKLQSEQLKEVNMVKDRLFSIISHDLRSPLRQLQAVLNLADRNQLTEVEIKGLLDQLKVNLGFNIELTDNLLFWARSQMEGAQVNYQPFHLFDLVEKKFQFFKHSTLAKKIEVSNRTLSDLEINSDENIIALVIHNLLANAIKFCENDDTIIVGNELRENEVVIYVSDTGVGMTTSDIQNILSNNIFTKQGTANEKGTGLGLKICKDLIHQINGRLWIESQPGIGTTFYFSVPNKLQLQLPDNRDTSVNLN